MKLSKMYLQEVRSRNLYLKLNVGGIVLFLQHIWRNKNTEASPEVVGDWDS